MKCSRFVFSFALVAILAGTAWVPRASAQWLLETKDQKANIKVGFLAQPQLEALDTPGKIGRSTNLFLRRFRILFGGKISDKWLFFFETDSPNLG
jgi:hypothetical protein